MNSKSDAVDYDILGFQVKLQPDTKSNVSPEEIVEEVRRETDRFLAKMPHLSAGEAILLTALKLAQDKIELEKEYRHEVDQFKASATDALKVIEEVSPRA